MPSTVASRPGSAPVMSRVQKQTSLGNRPGRRFLPKAERELDPVLRDLAAWLPGGGRGVSVIAEMPGRQDYLLEQPDVGVQPHTGRAPQPPGVAVHQVVAAVQQAGMGARVK